MSRRTRWRICPVHSGDRYTNGFQCGSCIDDELAAAAASLAQDPLEGDDGA